jgi:hypothetical protein
MSQWLMGFFTVNFTNFHLHGSVNIEFLPFARDSFKSLPIPYQFNQLKHATAYFPLGSATPLRRLQSKRQCSSDETLYRRQLRSHWGMGRSSSSFDKTHSTLTFTKLIVYSALMPLILPSQETCHVLCRPRHHDNGQFKIYSYLLARIQLDVETFNLDRRFPSQVRSLLSENSHLPTLSYLIHQESPISNHSSSPQSSAV